MSAVEHDDLRPEPDDAGEVAFYDNVTFAILRGLTTSGAVSVNSNHLHQFALAMVQQRREWIRSYRLVRIDVGQPLTLHPHEPSR